MSLRRPSIAIVRLSITRIGETFWFWPLVLGFLGIGLALGGLALDSRIAFTWLFRVYPWLAINAESARAVLSVCATAMISAASIVYSLSLLIRTIATSTLGPRLVQSFDKVRTNRFTLGVQLMSFIYCVSVLYAVGNLVEKQTLAVAGGVALTLGALVYLVIFVHAVARQVQVDVTIADVAASLRGRMKAVADFERNDASPPPDGKSVCAPRSGYVQLIDRESALRMAVKTRSVVAYEAREGDFIVAGRPLLRIASEAELTDEVGKDFASTVALGPQRTDEQDFRFQALLLTEIALRALSPGINDVFTAVACTDHLAGVLADLEGRDLTPGPLCDEDGVPRVFSHPLLFQDLVDAVMHPLRQSGASLPTMAITLLARLRDLVAVLPTQKARDLLAWHAELVAADAIAASSVEVDRAAFSALLDEVRALKSDKSGHG